jgi:hypothetical protein
MASLRRRFSAIPGIGLACLCLNLAAAQPPAVADALTSASSAGRPCAAIQGTTITLAPSRASFRIPQSWVSRNRPDRKSLHLSAAEIDTVRDGAGEWDTEYATVVNGLFPFEKCSVHAGGEGWGREGSSFGDIQMRAYILDDATPEQIAQRTVEDGAKIAGGLSHLKDIAGSGKISSARSELEGWTRASVTYGLWYWDYGGPARVDVFAKAFGKQSAVLVFMYCSNSARTNPEMIVADIVKSFKM